MAAAGEKEEKRARRARRARKRAGSGSISRGERRLLLLEAVLDERR